MLVKRIKPSELPARLTFQLNYLYHTELGKFVVAVDDKGETMYVNTDVPEKDADGFLDCVTFPCYWLGDNDAGKGEFLDYVYDRYGYETCRILTDSHSQHLEKEETLRAQEAAKKIIPLIEKELESELPAVEYDEYLAHEVWKHGFGLKRQTPRNMTGYGDVYVFYFGYLMGAGMLKGGVV